MGTPEFSVPTLDSLVAAGHQVVAVVTQPDKAKGRGKAVQFTPVKEKALEYGIKVYQPVKIKEEESVKILQELNPDAIIVVAFGQILSKEILDIPKYGCINVHASLLPKLRGSAPIQWSIINGEEETGITTMYMDVGVDTGDMLMKKVVPIDKKETGGSLHDKLAACGGELLVETLKNLEEGNLVRQPQDHSQFTYVSMLTKSLGYIDFTKSAVEIERLIRGLNPWPSAYTYLDGKTLKIWDADVIYQEYPGKCGEVVEVSKDALVIKTGEGALSVKDIQLEGKKRMTVDSFLRGYIVNVGTILKE